MENKESDAKLNLHNVLLKEIDLIQGCIERMAKNSFSIRGWTISLVAVILAILPAEVDLKIVGAVGVVCVSCFWYVDGFFLSCERLYRMKYEWVIANRLHCSDFCYDLNPHNERMRLSSDKKEPKPWKMMFTRTLIPIYGSLWVLSLLCAVGPWILKLLTHES